MAEDDDVELEEEETINTQHLTLNVLNMIPNMGAFLLYGVFLYLVHQCCLL